MRRLTVVAAEQKLPRSHAWALRGLREGKEAREDRERKATWRVDKTQTFIILTRRENRGKSHEDNMSLANPLVHSWPFISAHF